MGDGCSIKGPRTLDLIRSRTLAPGKWREYQYITRSPSANLHIHHTHTPRTKTSKTQITKTWAPNIQELIPRAQYPDPVPFRVCKLVNQ